ncbi:MAG: HD domain-containing protein [Nitrososphaeria archaeon]
MDKEVEEQVKEYVRSHFVDDASGHDWHHIERVYNMALKIAEKEGADRTIVGIAALLHDIGIRREIECGLDHSEYGASLSKKYLLEIGFDPSEIDRVVEAIREHRYGKQIKPKSLEGRVLQDADMLDAIGAIGIARAFAYGGARGALIYNPTEKVENYDPFKVKSTITHFKEKLLNIKDRFNTKTAKEIGLERHRFMEKFLEEFYNEIAGER